MSKIPLIHESEPMVVPSVAFSSGTVPVQTMVDSGYTISRGPTLRQRTVSPNWDLAAPSSVIYHPVRRLAPREPKSGLLIALLILIIGVIIGLIIWVIYLHVRQEATQDAKQRRRLEENNL